MKRIKKIFIIVSMITLMISLTGCNKRKPLSAEDFKTKMEEKSFVVSDATNQMQANNYIKKIYVAIEKDSNYQIEFYELNSDENAMSFYNNNKTLFESGKSSSAEETNKSVKNNSKYTLKDNKMYKIISRIDNTVIYINSNSEYEKEINSILSFLGY